MKPLCIERAACYIPEQTLTVSKDYASLGLSMQEAKIYERFYGLQRIPVTTDSTLELMYKSVLPLIKNIDKQRIKYIIAPRTTPVIAPFGTPIIRDLSTMLKLEHAVSFVTSMNKCVSTLRALQMAQQLLQASHAGAMVLLVTGETVFTVQNRILPNIAITAESAASALLSLSDHLPHQLISISYAVMGEYAGGAWMSLEQVGRFGAIFEATMLKVIKEALHKAGINFDQMVLLLPHNVNIPCWRGFAKYAQIPLEKIYLNNIAKTSHCFNSDLLINLVAATKEKYLKPGDYYVMATVGVGAMFGAAVFRY